MAANADVDDIQLIFCWETTGPWLVTDMYGLEALPCRIITGRGLSTIGSRPRPSLLQMRCQGACSIQFSVASGAVDT